MNNEPVAWMFQGAFDISTYVSIDKPNPDIYPNPIPLYTHPVKELTLTDEEIDNLIMDVAEKPTHEDLFDFAKEILRKAQEK